MALSESQRRANDKYIKEKYERLPVSYPKEFCEKVRKEAAKQEESLAGYIRQAIEQRMHRDNHPTTLDGQQTALPEWGNE